MQVKFIIAVTQSLANNVSLEYYVHFLSLSEAVNLIWHVNIFRFGFDLILNWVCKYSI